MGRIVEKNGKKYIQYKNNGKECLIRYKENKKNIRPKNMIYAIALISLIALCKNKVDCNKIAPLKLVMEDLTVDDIKETIYSSSNLTDDEKDYLSNTNYFNDILPYINKGVLSKIYFDSHLENMAISPFSEDPNGLYSDNTEGYYTLFHPRTLFIRDYENIGLYNEDVVSHEFVHMCQIPVNREIITEASAEIISSEYFENASIDSYYREVAITKILMEIIGSKPIWNYNFTGDFSMIEKEVKPYLNDEDYENFMKIKTYSTDAKTHTEDCTKIMASLENLYRAKYDREMLSDPIIDHIINKKCIRRYYFNKEFINNENSYYSDEQLVTTNIRDAYNEGDIYFFVRLRDFVYYDEAKEFMKNFTTEDSGMAGVVYGCNKGSMEILNGISDLESNNYTIYFVMGHKLITYEEFCENNSKLDSESEYWLRSRHGFINSVDSDGTIRYYKDVKTYIPTIEEKFSENPKKLIRS